METKYYKNCCVYVFLPKMNTEGDLFVFNGLLFRDLKRFLSCWSFVSYHSG